MGHLHLSTWWHATLAVERWPLLQHIACLAGIASKAERYYDMDAADLEGLTRPEEAMSWLHKASPCPEEWPINKRAHIWDSYMFIIALKFRRRL
jgi:hypothetical protein